MQRVVGVLRLLQHPQVELEPAQLAVDEALRPEGGARPSRPSPSPCAAATPGGNGSSASRSSVPFGAPTAHDDRRPLARHTHSHAARPPSHDRSEPRAAAGGGAAPPGAAAGARARSPASSRPRRRSRATCIPGRRSPIWRYADLVAAGARDRPGHRTALRAAARPHDPRRPSRPPAPRDRHQRQPRHRARRPRRSRRCPTASRSTAAAVAGALAARPRRCRRHLARRSRMARPGRHGPRATGGTWPALRPTTSSRRCGPPPTATRSRGSGRTAMAPLFAGPVADLVADLDAGHAARRRDRARPPAAAGPRARLAHRPQARRRHGRRDVSAGAAAVLACPEPERPAARGRVRPLAAAPRRLNPGTTADIVAAALYILLRTAGSRPARRAITDRSRSRPACPTTQRMTERYRSPAPQGRPRLLRRPLHHPHRRPLRARPRPQLDGRRRRRRPARRPRDGGRLHPAPRRALRDRGPARPPHAPAHRQTGSSRSRHRGPAGRPRDRR